MRVERRDESLTRHKLAAVAEGPLKVITATRKTIVIERPDKKVERVSRDRVTLAPSQRTAEGIQEFIRPMTTNELEAGNYPVNE